MTSDEDHRHLLRLIARRDASSEAAMAQFYRALSGAAFAFVQKELEPLFLKQEAKRRR